MMVSLDGYMEGSNHDLSWHNVDEEFNNFAINQLREVDTILFGRKTYQLMESFWPTKAGIEDDAEVAKIMNETHKIVISNNLGKVVETNEWRNITLIKDEIKDRIIELKNKSGKDILVLGSNNLCVTLLRNNLLDEIRIMINPVAIGKGTPLFKGIKTRYKFNLLRTQIFKSGNILHYYKPVE